MALEQVVDQLGEVSRFQVALSARNDVAIHFPFKVKAWAKALGMERYCHFNLNSEVGGTSRRKILGSIDLI